MIDTEDNGELKWAQSDLEWSSIRMKENVHDTLNEKRKLQINLQILFGGRGSNKPTIPSLHYIQEMSNHTNANTQTLNKQFTLEVFVVGFFLLHIILYFFKNKWFIFLTFLKHRIKRNCFQKVIRCHIIF